MENYNTYGSQSVETVPATYASDETRQSDTQQQNARLLYQAMRYKSLARSGATWFYWIAGLSLINSILFFTGSMGAGAAEPGWVVTLKLINSILFFTGSYIDFLAGLGITRLINWYMSDTQTGMIIGFGLSVVIAAGLAAVGYFGHKTEYRWAYIAGMVFYALDGAMLLALQSWLSLLFHGYVLYRLYAGLQAGMELSKVEQQLDGFAPAQVMMSK